MEPILTRRRALLLVPTGILAVGLAGAGAYLLMRGDDAAPAIGGPFALVDGDGQAVTEAQFRGRWMMVYFGYTHCPDACPTALQDMANALDALGAKKAEVVAVFITVDPERDTPAVMKDYVAAFDSAIVPLTGSVEAVARVAREYRVYYARHPTSEGGYDMDHSSIIYVMDRAGRFVTNFTHETPPDQMAAKLRTLV